MKLVFIAGPLTTGWNGKDNTVLIDNIRKAESYQIALINAGIGCFCAHTHTSFHHEKGSTAPETFYYEMDLEFLKRCDALLAVPGWETSGGASREVAWAKENNLPVFFPSSPEDIGEIVKWEQN